MNHPCIPIFMGQKICVSLSESDFGDDISQRTDWIAHGNLFLGMSESAIMYALKERSASQWFLAGLFLAEAVLRDGDSKQISKAINILMTALQRDPELESEALQRLLFLLFNQQRRSA